MITHQSPSPHHPSILVTFMVLAAWCSTVLKLGPRLKASPAWRWDNDGLNDALWIYGTTIWYHDMVPPTLQTITGANDDDNNHNNTTRINQHSNQTP